MNCQEVQGLLSLYLYGELDFAQEDNVEEHLAECASCQLSLAREKEWHTLTNAQGQEPSLDLLAACRRQLPPAIARESAPQPPQRTVRSWWRWGNPFEISATPWSSQLAFASLLVFVGFAAARFLDHGSLLSSTPVNSMGVFNPGNALIRDIQTDNSGLVKIVFDQESEISGQVNDADVRRLLLSGARQPDPGVRFYSVQLLSRIKHADDIRQALFDAVRGDPDPSVRLAAIDGLRSFSTDPAALDTLKFVLQHDDSPGVRYQAIDILIPPGQDLVITPAMTQMVEEVMRSAPADEYVRNRCTRILTEANLPVVY